MKMNNNHKEEILIDLDDDLRNCFVYTLIPQLFFDKDLILRKFTHAARKLFFLLEDDIGRSVHDLMNKLRYPSIIENINWVITNEKILEKVIQSTNLCWSQINIIPYSEKNDNELNGVIINFVDITNRIQGLKEQEKIISDYAVLLKTISHDIKNRLGGMLLSIDMLKLSEIEGNDDIQYYLDTLEDGVHNIDLIVGELVESKNHNKKYKDVDEILNIEHILEDVQYALINEITQSNTTIICEVESQEIIFSRKHLRRIIYNLVSNSIKFKNPERNPEILIKTSSVNNHIIISVKDNGIGMAPEKQEDFFTKSFRIKNSLDGSEAGLHLVRTLVTNAKGMIEIESQLGVGTEFKIFLKQEISKQ